MATTTNIEVSKIEGHPNNPRKDLGDLTELAESIRANGILQNLTVVPQDVELYQRKTSGKKAYTGGYTAIIGHRRLAAARLAGLTEVPCIIADMDEKKQISIMLLENMQRSDLTVYEEAQGFQMMLDFGFTVEDISQKTGLSDSTIRRRTKLLELEGGGFKAAVERGASLTDFVQLDKIRSNETKNNLLDKIGTPNFNFSLQTAIDDEAKAASVAALLEVLDTFAERVEIQNERQTALYINKSAHINFQKPEDAGSKKYYYLETEYSVQLLTQREQSSKPTADNERRRKLKDLYSRLDEISERAQKLRYSFIKNYTAPRAKKNAPLIMEYAVRRMIKSRYCDINEEWLLDILEIKAAKDDKFSFETLAEAFTLCPERVLLAAVYCNDMDGGYMKYYNFQCEHTSNARLNETYDFLAKLGYLMSDEEKALASGTHEQLKAENYRFGLLDRQRCGGCGAPLCKDITLCKECVNKISEENTQLRELLRLAVEDMKLGRVCATCKHIQTCGEMMSKTNQNKCVNTEKWQWQNADKLKELGIEI